MTFSVATWFAFDSHLSQSFEISLFCDSMLVELFLGYRRAALLEADDGVQRALRIHPFGKKYSFLPAHSRYC